MKNNSIEISRVLRNLRYHCSETQNDFKFSSLYYGNITLIADSIIRSIDSFLMESPINEKVKNNIKKQIRNEK